MEEQLEQVNADIEQLAKEIKQSASCTPPMFETFVTVYSLAFAAFLWFVPGALPLGAGLHDWKPYQAMLWVMPQDGWAFAFMAGSLMKAIGLLRNWRPLRVIGLCYSLVLYGLLTGCYAFGFPASGLVVFSVMTLFTALSIPQVKTTGLRGGEREKHEN